jgi:acyl-coenzyme A thioesterase PaaI-like protein
MKAALLRRAVNLWPPLFGSGIHIARLSPDFRDAEILLRQGWFSGNRHRAHFGGSLFALTDIGYAFMIGRIMGRDYAVWDKAGEIEFVSPGRGTVRARFHLSAEKIAEIRDATRAGAKYLPVFDVDVVDDAGKLVARARRTIYVRRRRRSGPLDKAGRPPISG